LKETRDLRDIVLLRALKNDPLKMSSAIMLSQMDEDKTRKVYEYLADQKRLEDTMKDKGV
jgi:hypothetical protein